MRYALVLKEVGQGLRRNLSMVVSVVLVTFVSLTFVGAAIVMQMQISQMKSFWYDRAQVAVYMCTEVYNSQTCAGSDATPEQVENVRSILESDALAPFIEDVTFLDRDAAFEAFSREFEGNAIVDISSPADMNETFWIKLKDPSQSAVISETLSNISGVQSVSDQRSLLDRIFNVLNAASYTALSIAGLMLVAAVLLISTTIRLSAFSRRREIGIMRLVGASNRFIQTPFIIEGIISALIGAVLASLATVAIVEFFVQGVLVETLPTFSYISTLQSLVIPPILVALGILLSGLAAKVAITRYLRV
ncbi:permease-like cell division protein FtsX [Lysinibacter sp. HNR]|uniref:permease-like cell division protein FtsX n=1 Tax=Lysinibacter sp. HNR TaxID=3031408 RepID=UPI0024357542|nr:permease-like cell division protein FtsX [Lysinibacter sp. HNR]WGD36666.1 permease-like cell division protein FtsX [Lysinibacter sp. HNR]